MDIRRTGDQPKKKMGVCRTGEQTYKEKLMGICQTGDLIWYRKKGSGIKD